MPRKLELLRNRSLLWRYNRVGDKGRCIIPSYDYECEACGHELESFHAMSAKPIVVCPECHESKLVKLISPGATVIVRGTKNPCRGTRRKTNKKVSKEPSDRLGAGKNKTEKPFWRDGPIDKNVLKNPDQYIKQGKVD